MEIVEAVALAGFDAILLDMEHGSHTIESVQRCLIVAERHGMATLVRIPDLREGLIKVLLDLGVDGLVAPGLKSAADAEQLVQDSRFTPEGKRGANPWVRAASFGGANRFYAQQNDEVALIGIPGTRGGLEALEDIAGVPGLDALFIGPVDVSHFLGVPGELEHPLVVSKISELVATAKENGKATGVFCANIEQATRWRSLGVDFLVLGVDANTMVEAFTSALYELRRA